MSNKEELKKENDFETYFPEAYPELMLIECLNGSPCDYGICDECPNNLGRYGRNKHENKDD